MVARNLVDLSKLDGRRLNSDEYVPFWRVQSWGARGVQNVAAGRCSNRFQKHITQASYGLVRSAAVDRAHGFAAPTLLTTRTRAVLPQAPTEVYPGSNIRNYFVEGFSADLHSQLSNGVCSGGAQAEHPYQKGVVCELIQKLVSPAANALLAEPLSGATWKKQLLRAALLLCFAGVRVLVSERKKSSLDSHGLNASAARGLSVDEILAHDDFGLSRYASAGVPVFWRATAKITTAKELRSFDDAIKSVFRGVMDGRSEKDLAAQAVQVGLWGCEELPVDRLADALTPPFDA